MDTAAKLETRGLSKTFEGSRANPARVTALEGVDLVIGDGEFVSLVGPSGCGKSTLFNMIAGLVTPSSGEILLDGVTHRRLLGKVGYMPQRDCLMPWRNVLDNICLGMETAGGMRRRAARKVARSELARFGLEGFERRWPADLSGGMRQRAALLRTFLAQRPVMLLDEPFGALDALTRSAMQAWLLEVWEADRKTILFITHDVEEAVLLSDRVYVMSGRPGAMRMCVEIDLPRPRSVEVTSTPRFQELRATILAPLQRAALEQAGLAA